MKKSTKIVSVLVLVLAVFALAGCGNEYTAKLKGTWKSASGDTLTFTDTKITIAGVAWDYTATADTVTWTPKLLGVTLAAITYEYEISGTTLTWTLSGSSIGTTYEKQ